VILLVGLYTGKRFYVVNAINFYKKNTKIKQFNRELNSIEFEFVYFVDHTKKVVYFVDHTLIMLSIVHMF